jgi:Domain of unknown function (DUF4214)
MRYSTFRGVCFAILGFTLVTLLGLGVYLAQTSSATSLNQLPKANVIELQGRMTQQDLSARPGTITPLEDAGVIDMGRLGIRPLTAPMNFSKPSSGPGADSNAVGKGAFFGTTHQVVNQNTVSAFGTLGSGFTPAESVQFFLNGVVAGTFVADANGRLAVGITTGAGFGFITLEEVGTTSGKRAGGIVQVASTGPYLPGVTTAPHAVNTSAGGTFLYYGFGYPASTNVPIFRNTVSLGTALTNAAGRFFVTITPANNGNTSAVYHADTGVVGSVAGVTVEERSDAGTPPVGDQNLTRLFIDRPVLDSAVGGVVGLVGEGFQAGENVAVSGCTTTTIAASANGSVGALIGFLAGAGVSQCTFTGATSARVSRGTIVANALTTNLRAAIVNPALAAPGGTVTVLLDRLTPNDTGQVFLDGVSQGTATSSPSGALSFTVTKPSTVFVHEVGWVSNTGGADAIATVLLILGNPTAAPGTISGRIAEPDGSPLGGTVVRLNGAASRSTVSDGGGNYHFENVETDNFYTVTPSLANYSFSPPSRSFSLTGNMTDAGFTANPDATQTANAIDTTEYFVRQQYLDFLGREPDQGGLEYWSSQFDVCNGDATCIRNKRIDVSAAFFASVEFQQTGSYIYGVYAGTLGRTLNYGEFNADRSQVLGGAGLDPAKTVFAQNFVQRNEFTNRYPQSMTREEFVDAILQTMSARSGVNHSSLRAGLLSDYDTGGRALVVRQASEASSFVAAEYNKAFVLMEYFGYLQREIDQGGYDFWLDVLNNGTPGNYHGMVCSFLTSMEYQHRFSNVITHSNAECSQ